MWVGLCRGTTRPHARWVKTATIWLPIWWVENLCRAVLGCVLGSAGLAGAPAALASLRAVARLLSGPSHFLAGESGLVRAVPGQGPRTAWNRARQLEAPAWDCRAGLSRHLPPSPVCGGLGGVTVSHEQSWRPPLPPPTHANSRLPGRPIQEEPFRGHVTGGFLVVRILREWRREPKIHSRL